ncbi:MAG TPA: bifunctional serine/threonine-protein kinase/formylglycine-generating enzyme family protein [Haliangiales bacterium]|nr:bifunctional serine/threonine-protein kinase/formylglycine-generating enzyme family protein [Haliangiales bacterium]
MGWPMASHLPQGAALLVAGYPAASTAGVATPVLQTLGQIGETLLATASSWRIRRLSPTAGERYTPDKASLKRHISDLTQYSADVVILAAVGAITTHSGEPALVAGSHHEDFPDDATLPLSWIRDRWQVCRARCALILVSADGPSGRAAAWLHALATNRPTHVIAVHASQAECQALDALLSGLCGEATDPRSGTITLRSISEHLAKSVPRMALQPSAASETLAVSRPLGGLWDFRLSHRALISRRAVARQPEPRPPEELIHVILPGRFRVERELAKGSFATVYRARQLTVERDVAIKVLHSGIDPASVDGRLFVQEIQSVGRLDHSNVVRIYQADITPDGRLFFAMELLVGRDLQQIVTEEGPVARERAIGLVEQLLAGLAAAHEAGLIHADVKPANAIVVRGRTGERLVLVDFGLARLRPHGRAVESAGGTPAYMAPEQLNEGRVDARSDVFSAALVLVTLLTGWRRRSAEELVPPVDAIPDADLRVVLTRALAVDPAARFATAADFADALTGKARVRSQTIAAPPPFRHLAPLTERDRGRLHGRERDVAGLTDHVLYRRAVVYTAPSGTGKTSLLRAGLLARLEELRVRPVYLSCRTGAAATLAGAIWPGAAGVSDAIACWHERHRGKLVLIVDQLEVILADEEPRDADADIVRQVLAFERWPVDADVSVVLSVREDFLARLIERSRHLEEGIPVLRLGPLAPEGAREAISGPLTEARLSVAPDLLDVMLGDLQAAAAAIGPEMGWGAVPAVYPPHLQLACSVLCEALAPGEATLTLAHYRRLGGLDAIVGEYLDRVLDTELDADAAAIARDLFLALVTSAHTRAVRTEADLMDVVAGRHDPQHVAGILEVLHARGLVVRLRTSGGEPGWELIHDSLVPRVLGWIDRRDLARRRAIELVRYHLRRSQPDKPSLLNRAELRELRSHADAVGELETEWAHRRSGGQWTPAELVAASRLVFRRRALVWGAIGALALAIAGTITYRWAVERARAQREQGLLERDMGRFALELAPFDWDVDGRKPVALPADALPNLRWQLHEPDPDDPDSPGKPVAEFLVVRGTPAPASDRLSRVEHVEARGGRAYLVVTGRGQGSERCAPSIVPLRQLPGYALRNRNELHVRVRVPTCQVTRAEMQMVSQGPSIRGGAGDPISHDVAASPDAPPETTIALPTFWIDRTETSNAAFAAFAAMEDVTGVSMPAYPETRSLQHAARPAWPVSAITWVEARAYCRFLGKQLPSTEQWEKAMRGGLVLPDGTPNPRPRRNFPWGAPLTPVPAKVRDTGAIGPAPVASFPGDVSPYGVFDLAGNLQEWTDSIRTSGGKPSRGFRITRGGNWDETSSADLVDYLALENERPMGTRNFALGMRCARQ